MDEGTCTGGGAEAVVLGVDTHLERHVAVALDGLGRRLGELSAPATASGYAELLSWAESLGALERVGIEGACSYGAGLSRYLKAHGVEVLETERPKRRHRRGSGKSDPVDAEIAARAVLAGQANGVPKSGEGQVEMIRALRSVRRSAVKAKDQAGNQLRALLVTAPEGLRARLRGLPTKRLAAAAARFRPGERPVDAEAATKLAMRSVARRYLALSEEVFELDGQLERLVTETAPALVSLHGVGTDSAATLLVAAGDNPERMRSEASFASLCGVAPIPASSGKVVRHRLSRYGNRDANRALYMIALIRMRWDRRTREYVARRTAEGKSKREIIRCLKRFIAREAYRALTSPGAASSPDLATHEEATSSRGHRSAAQRLLTA
jgi:transposase